MTGEDEDEGAADDDPATNLFSSSEISASDDADISSNELSSPALFLFDEDDCRSLLSVNLGERLIGEARTAGEAVRFIFLRVDVFGDNG